jgi:hypothetical protein
MAQTKTEYSGMLVLKFKVDQVAFGHTISGHFALDRDSLECFAQYTTYSFDELGDGEDVWHEKSIARL